jgi:hypothetical protein
MTATTWAFNDEDDDKVEDDDGFERCVDDETCEDFDDIVVGWFEDMWRFKLADAAATTEGLNEVRLDNEMLIAKPNKTIYWISIAIEIEQKRRFPEVNPVNVLWMPQNQWSEG